MMTFRISKTVFAFLTLVMMITLVSESAEARRHHRKRHRSTRLSRIEQKNKEIRQGLCTPENKNRRQWKRGYCDILTEIVNNPNTCAGKIVDELVSEQRQVGQMGNYCSTYSSMVNQGAGKDFYVQILAAMATVESDWNPNTAGDGGRSRGLLQVSVGDDYSDCAQMTSRNITNPRVNLLCGACEAMVNLKRDGTIGTVTSRGAPLGMARSYGPFRKYLGQVQIASITNQYCVASAQQLQYKAVQEARVQSTSDEVTATN